MPTISTAGILIGLACLQCQAQVTKNPVPKTTSPTKQPPKAVPSPVQVSRGKSEMDDKHWTILTVRAKVAYQNAIGISVRPELDVNCIQRGEERKVNVVFESGQLQTPTPVEYCCGLRTKLDEGDPFKTGWSLQSDYKSLMYYDPLTDSDGISRLDFEKMNRLVDNNNWRFVQTILAANTLLLEIAPFMGLLDRIRKSHCSTQLSGKRQIPC